MLEYEEEIWGSNPVVDKLLTELKIINFDKRNMVKKILFKGAVVGAGLLGLSGMANATSVYWRDESGTLTDLVSGEVNNFSYDTVDTGVTVTIPTFQQMIVDTAIEVNGTIVINGTLVII